MMKPLSRLITLISLVGLSACEAAPTATPTAAQSTVSPSATATTVLTPTTSPTAIPTPTPDVPFSADGPWLLFTGSSTRNGPLYLWAANPDGKALHQIGPEPVRYFAVRPQRNQDGQVEVAYVTSADYEGKVGLALQMVTLPNRRFRLLTRLTSDQTGWKDGDNIGEPLTLKSEVTTGLNEHHLAWSPDGRWLAFNAARDGPSIDVYSYEADTGDIRRLTSGAKHANDLVWSQDSQYIVHTSVKCFACAEYTASGLWAARPDGLGVVQLEARVPDNEMDNLRYLEQIAPDVFLAATVAQGGQSLGNLRLASLSTGAVRYLAPDMGAMGILGFPSIDIEDHVALIHCGQSSGELTQEGWYLVNATGKATYLPDAKTGWSSEWDSVAHMFVVVNAPTPYGITPDGKIVEAPPYMTYPSPDGSVSVLIPRLESISLGIWISWEGSEPFQVLAGHDRGYRVSWSPDSQAFVYSGFSRTLAENLLVAHAPDFVPVSIAGDLSQGYWDLDWHAAWTP